MQRSPEAGILPASGLFDSTRYFDFFRFFSQTAAWAAASRAMGTRYGEQLT